MPPPLTVETLPDACRQILRHALGLLDGATPDVCRNHYVLYEESDGFKECMQMVGLGLLEVGQDAPVRLPMMGYGGSRPHFHQTRQITFHVTDRGLDHV